MRAAFAAVISAAVLLASSQALSSERRPRVEQDDCSRRSLSCEKQCDAKRGSERLSCKTDCRLEESRCRNGRR